MEKKKFYSYTRKGGKFEDYACTSWYSGGLNTITKKYYEKDDYVGLLADKVKMMTDAGYTVGDVEIKIAFSKPYGVKGKIVQAFCIENA